MPPSGGSLCPRRDMLQVVCTPTLQHPPLQSSPTGVFFSMHSPCHCLPKSARSYLSMPLFPPSGSKHEDYPLPTFPPTVHWNQAVYKPKEISSNLRCYLHMLDVLDPFQRNSHQHDSPCPGAGYRQVSSHEEDVGALGCGRGHGERSNPDLIWGAV